MWELMKGVKFLIQLGLLLLASLFFFISYGAGIWWSLQHNGLHIGMTLWRICSKYGDNEVCNPLSGSYMEEVILTTQACGGICVVMMIVMIGFSIFWFIEQRRGSTEDTWLHARSVIVSLLVLFLLITLAHSENCPPKYNFGNSSMEQEIGWGWGLALTSMFLILPVWVAHIYESVQMYRSDSTKR